MTSGPQRKHERPADRSRPKAGQRQRAGPSSRSLPGSRALAVAVARDFGAGRASIEGVDIDAPLIDDLARKHRALLYAQQRGLSRVLAEANRQGEVGRKEEMKRIFGVEI